MMPMQRSKHYLARLKRTVARLRARKARRSSQYAKSIKPAKVVVNYRNPFNFVPDLNPFETNHQRVVRQRTQSGRQGRTVRRKLVKRGVLQNV